MPKTATPRKPETVERKLAETKNKSKNRSLASILGIGENEKRLARDIGSGLNDVIGRGTIAGLLGAPGDIAGVAENSLRGLLGLQQVRPWGGSEHIGQTMQDYGLVSPERRPKTELLASLISPSQVATAGYKAPQMARAGVKMLDNLAAPRTMGRQQGAIENLWHGSPHTFDRFDLSKIGTGEGAQAYGHGAYLAESPDVARGYKDKLSGGIFNSTIYLDGVKHEPRSDIEKRALAIIGRDGIGSYKQVYSASKRDGIHTDGELAEMKRVLDFAKGKEVKSAVEDGALYQTRLAWPDPAKEAASPLSPDDFLHWDKPLSEQSPAVRDSLNKAISLMPPERQDLFKVYPLQDFQLGKDIKEMVGERLMGQSGIPGIRYLDGGSRGAGEGSHNYVVFDDKLIDIVSRNGQPVR